MVLFFCMYLLGKFLFVGIFNKSYVKLKDNIKLISYFFSFHFYVQTKLKYVQKTGELPWALNIYKKSSTGPILILAIDYYNINIIIEIWGLILIGNRWYMVFILHCNICKEKLPKNRKSYCQTYFNGLESYRYPQIDQETVFKIQTVEMFIIFKNILLLFWNFVWNYYQHCICNIYYNIILCIIFEALKFTSNINFKVYVFIII